MLLRRLTFLSMLFVLTLLSLFALLLTPVNAAPSFHAGEFNTAKTSRYLVGMKQNRDVSSLAQHFSSKQNLAPGKRAPLQIKRLLRRSINGGVLELTPSQALQLIKDPSVAFVEADRQISLVETQTRASWGLDRIDQRDLPFDREYNYDFTGAGVHAYILDTGLRHTHVDFEGRADLSANFVSDGVTDMDCHGHGSQVASKIGGVVAGVAKQVSLHGIRVLNCRGSGWLSDIVEALEWVLANAEYPAIVNMSLAGRGNSASLNTAIQNLTDAGISVVVAAGNARDDACGYTPASSQHAVTVGATTKYDKRARFSNWGTCVDLFAPGARVKVVKQRSDTGYRGLSGTSFSAPMVAGAMALLLEADPSLTPEEVRASLQSQATPDVLLNLNTGSPNLLLFSLIGPN